ncbi:hypothetical protein [Thalassolituus oleivorans]|uniref:hypothetical protein n=1 Tax=Thalassolituus oleivorans TaxID=187493 RepID=UPI0023F3F05D|nr:hypothetical protein [Thalassolituus oleivorans]
MSIFTRLPNHTVSINLANTATHRIETTGAITALTVALAITITKAGEPMDLELFRGFDLLKIDQETGEQTPVEPIGYLSNSEFRALNALIEAEMLPASWEEIDAMIEAMRAEKLAKQQPEEITNAI